MLTKISVADYMTKRLVTLSKETNVIDAIKKLLDHKITCAPVIDQPGHLIGMFSEKDGMRVFLESVYDQGMGGKVGDFMATEIISVDAKSSIVDLAEKFQGSSVRSFPVFDHAELVGIISRTDVLRALVSID
ncbi:CBS domain-containing protein [Methyloglobulus sp.]|uniref:CBS domain-containing protein n=1 Tax=Methyloglobulus sp. TaxID=2518622 RepID=UPI0039895009